MKFGNPWSPEEETILQESATVFDAQVNLKAAGYERSMEAIKRKARRLGPSKNWFEKAFGVLEDLPNADFPKEFHSTIPWHSGELSINKLGLTKFVMLNDVHVPHNIDLTHVFEFIKDYKPHYILLVGDIINNDPFNHWEKKSPLRFKTMPQPKKHYEECNKLFFDPLRAVAGHNCVIVYMKGNHEWWSDMAVEDMPEGQGYWEVENNIRNIDLWVQQKGMVNLGKLHFTHGDIIRGGRYHSLKMLNYFRRNIRYGHYHNLEESSYTSPVDVSDRHTARCCGTLEKPNPDFMANRPHDWIACVTYGVVKSDGNFFDHSAVITNNSFMANGKIYG